MFTIPIRLVHPSRSGLCWACGGHCPLIKVGAGLVGAAQTQKSGGSEGWCPEGVGPEGVGARFVGPKTVVGPNFALFFPSCVSAGASHDSPRAQAHFRAPTFKTPTKFHEKTPREGRKNESCGGRGKKKARNFGPLSRRTKRKRDRKKQTGQTKNRQTGQKTDKKDKKNNIGTKWKNTNGIKKQHREQN